MQEQVLLVKEQANDALCDWYNAADVYCLASCVEGWPNVLLESLACGTPVVATGTWGVPEIITSERYGVLVKRTPESLAQGILAALERDWIREELSAYASTQTWHLTAQKVIDAFQKLLEASARSK